MNSKELQAHDLALDMIKKLQRERDSAQADLKLALTDIKSLQRERDDLTAINAYLLKDIEDWKHHFKQASEGRDKYSAQLDDERSELKVAQHSLSVANRLSAYWAHKATEEAEHNKPLRTQLEIALDALEDIEKHMRHLMRGGCEMSTTYSIAERAIDKIITKKVTP